MDANKFGTFAYPKTPERGGEVTFNIMGVWSDDSRDLDLVSYDFYTKDTLIKTVSYNCGVLSAECPPPRIIDETSDGFVYASFLWALFDIPETAPTNQAFNVRIFGKTKDVLEPIWELES